MSDSIRPITDPRDKWTKNSDDGQKSKADRRKQCAGPDDVDFTAKREPDRALQIFGWLSVLCSAFCFYLATAIIRWSQTEVEIQASFFVFARFLLGFLVVCLTMLFYKQQLRPKRYHYLLGRTIANIVAVFCFYKAVEVTSVVEANILNMTYPIFIAIFSWFLLPEQRSRLTVFLVFMAFLGIWLILAPSGGLSFGRHSLWGLTSGLSAAGAMIYLNISRQYHHSQTILFFMFGIGTLAILVFSHETIFIPDSREFFYLVTCSIAGVLGQYLLTFGFRFVKAVEGSIISSTRILLAALLGPVLVSDPSLTSLGWLGAFLIFSANIFLTINKRTHDKTTA